MTCDLLMTLSLCILQGAESTAQPATLTVDTINFHCLESTRRGDHGCNWDT